MENKLRLRNIEQNSIRQRLELVEDRHTIRGTPFRGVADVLEKLCGADQLERISGELGLDPRFSMTKRYPLRDFLRFEQAAAMAIAETNGGDFDTAIAECGAGAVSLFFDSRAGEVMKGLSGRSPHRMLSSVPVGYQVLVNFGERRWNKIDENSGVFEFRNDLLGIMHNYGIFETALSQFYGAEINFELNLIGLIDFDFRLSW